MASQGSQSIDLDANEVCDSDTAIGNSFGVFYELDPALAHILTWPKRSPRLSCGAICRRIGVSRQIRHAPWLLVA